MGQEALQQRSDLPWYDPDKDSLRRIEVPQSEDDQRRHSRWASAAATSKRPVRAGNASWFWQFMQAIAWLFLGACLALLIWWLVKAALSADTLGPADDREARSVRGELGRVEELPIPVPPHQHDLLAVARSYFEAGDYGNAIIYAYAYQLVELDKHHLIRLTKGKTNRQYLRELRARPRLVALIHDTMLAFEDVFFGHHALSPQRFQLCWNSLDDFHRQLEQALP